MKVANYLEHRFTNPKNQVSVTGKTEIWLIQQEETGFFSHNYEYSIGVLAGVFCLEITINNKGKCNGEIGVDGILTASLQNNSGIFRNRNSCGRNS